MQLNWNDLALLAILSAVLHWLVARSEIMRVFWSRITGWGARLLACPACSGFWIGCALTALDIHAVSPFSVGRPDTWQFTAVSIITNGLLAMFLTPVVEGVLLWGLSVSAIEIESTPDDTQD